MKNEHTFYLPTLNETGDPSGIFFSDRYAQLVSGGRGYDENCAVVIESDDYEILMNLERTFAEQRAFCEVSEAAFYFDWLAMNISLRTTNYMYLMASPTM